MPDVTIYANVWSYNKKQGVIIYIYNTTRSCKRNLHRSTIAHSPNRSFITNAQELLTKITNDLEEEEIKRLRRNSDRTGKIESKV